MTPFMEPSYTLLAFLFAKKFIYAEFILLLALLRVVLATGAARWVALVCAGLAGAVTLTVFAPAFNLMSSSAYPVAVQAINHGQGLSVLITLSLLLAASGILPGRRHVWIDVLHGLLVLGLLGLWIATMF